MDFFEAARLGDSFHSMSVERIEPDFKRSRFAPSTTGRAHPGTLLAGLLCWLDARARGAQILLRLEDLDRERTKKGFVDALVRDLEWFGLDWDMQSLQSDCRARHEAALDELVETGRVYACDCSRTSIRAAGERAPDGSYRYPGTCRSQVVSTSSWRTIDRPLRLAIEAQEVRLMDESGIDLSGDAASLFGDPILRRRDGAYAYHFASVVDDAACGIDRIVRGRDLLDSTLVQVGLQREMRLPTPTYRHHGLFVERSGAKLSKSHGAIGLDALRGRYSSAELCGRLASFVGLVPAGSVCAPEDLVAEFDWGRIDPDDVELRWDAETGLAHAPGRSAPRS